MGASIRNFLQTLGLVQPETTTKDTRPRTPPPARPTAPVIKPASSQQIFPDFDLGNLRCQEEIESWQRMQHDANFAQRMKDKIENIEKARFEERIRLLTSSYKLDENITPALSNVVKLVISNLRLVQPVDVFIENDSSINAFCLPSRKTGRLILGLNSGLIELMTEKELAFVVGHEIGHAILGHSEIPYGDYEDDNFSVLEVVKLRNLSRHMEISADRIGLIACQDINIAGSALFKLVAGLSSRWVKFDPDAYEKHIEQLAENIDLLGIERQGLTHPITPLRVKALKIFRESEPYAIAFKQSNWKFSSTELEKYVEHLLALVEPKMDFETKNNSTVVSSFLLNASLLLLTSDGKFSAVEKKWLQNRFNIPIEALNNLLNSETLISDLEDATGNFGDQLTITMSPVDRVELLKILCSAVLADGVVAEVESQRVMQILQLLKLNENALQCAFESAQTEHDASKNQRTTRKRKSKDQQ